MHAPSLLHRSPLVFPLSLTMSTPTVTAQMKHKHKLMNRVIPRSILIILALLLLAPSFTGTVDARIRIEDIVGMWLFDEIEKEGPRRLVRDFSGRGHDGVVTGDPELVDGMFGKALKFGKGKYVEVAHHEDLRITDVITISAWVRRPLRKEAKDLGLAPFFIVEKGGIWAFDQQGEAAYGMAIHKILDNMLLFFYKGGWKGASGIPDDNWHHYVIVAKEDGINVTMYIDGQNKPVKHSDGQERIQMFPSKKPLHIGALMPERFDSYSETTIDEVIIFNAALSADDVGQLRGGFFAVSPSAKLATTWGEIKDKH